MNKIEEDQSTSLIGLTIVIFICIYLLYFISSSYKKKMKLKIL